MPYIDISLRWIDANTINASNHIGSNTYSDVDVGTSFGARQIGLVSIVRDASWDARTATPQNEPMFIGEKNVAVKLATINKGDRLKEGTIVDENTPCPTVSDEFGALPSVQQYQVTIDWSDGRYAAHDCYIVAKATITAGVYGAQNCVVNSSSASSDRFATCHVHDNVQEMKRLVTGDWLANLALGFTSETLKYTVLQNYSQPISQSLDDYTTGMLTLGYQAAHGALVKSLGNATEKAEFYLAEPMVQASINKTRLYAWLGLNATLTVAAVIVYFAHRASAARRIRDATLAPLMMDLTNIVHDNHASGLCNSASLNKASRALPRMKWKNSQIEDAGSNNYCRQTVSFVDSNLATSSPQRAKKRTTIATILAKIGQVPGNM